MECMRTKIKLIGIPSLVLITLILVGILVIETKAWKRFQTWLNTNCVSTSNDVELANVEANVEAMLNPLFQLILKLKPIGQLVLKLKLMFQHVMKKILF